MIIRRRRLIGNVIASKIFALMKYEGPNPYLVMPVLEMAQSGFRPATSPNAAIENVVFTADVESATERSFSQDFEPLIPLDAAGIRLMGLSHPDETAGWLWRDILSNMIAQEVWTTEYHEWARENREVRGAIFEACDTWRSISDRILSTAPALDEDIVTDIGEDIAATLLYTAYSRAFHGKTETYYDLLFGYIRLGYWPCGFNGKWLNSGQHVLWYPDVKR
ncbi:hypothetical protein Enr13x_09260 [Stieleria neptunia]|uniref:Uncharacterized protein n=1 Tax=Stieleria neptunia TaxID=2527979 RepID=A0A518HJR1_9BACT|nr:hypothetical protein [Stieleria neptunia]QDV41088.1 hypothetical protein Enr13x_09260 [Stieleria neptunia]